LQVLNCPAIVCLSFAGWPAHKRAKANIAKRILVPQLDEALRMLDTFASVGATHFDLTHLGIDGEKRGFRPEQSVAQVKNSMPKLFPGAMARQNNIIVRPLSRTVHFVQLDDLDAAGLGRVGEAAFLTLETSPGNHQAWVAVSGLITPEETKDFARRLRKGEGPTIPPPALPANQEPPTTSK
jgi:hypothetical protein